LEWVECDNAENLGNIRLKEYDITKVRLQKILDTGVNVIFCTKSIDDFAAKYLVEKKAMGLRRVEKGDLRRISKMTGAEIITSLADESGEETYTTEMQGIAESV